MLKISRLESQKEISGIFFIKMFAFIVTFYTFASYLHERNRTKNSKVMKHLVEHTPFTTSTDCRNGSAISSFGRINSGSTEGSKLLSM